MTMLVTKEFKLNCRGKETIITAKVPPKIAKVFEMVSEVHAERRDRLQKIGEQLIEGFAFEVEWRKQASKQATVFVQEELSLVKDMLNGEINSNEITPNDVY